MPRGVLVVNVMEIDGKNVNSCVIDEGFVPTNSRPMFRFDCSATDPEFANLRAKPPQVRLAGQKLYRALVASEAGTKFFAQSLAVPAPAPLFIHIEPPDVEELPWETLYDGSFRALDGQGRYPIARLASPAKRAEPLNRIIGNELRVAVVLAAARESGATEWSNISGALQQFKVPVAVLGLVSEAATIETMTTDGKKWEAQTPLRSVKVEYVGDDKLLMSQLRAHVPNIIHFFCHGVADVFPQLELESRADRLTDADRGSIPLGIELLKELSSAKSLWLVVLNCCQGAKAAPQLHSLARDLVAAGVPAVVAMRESIDVNDANLFSEHFYKALFAQLTATFNLKAAAASSQPLPMPELVWVRAVDAARRKLSELPRQAESSVEWTYPVVYVHRDELALHPRNLIVTVLTPERRLELLTELDMLRQMRGAIAMGTDAEAAERGPLDARIAELEGTLASP